MAARRRRTIAAGLAVSAVVLTLIAAPAAGAWKPGKPRYGVGERRNVPVTMRDGTVLRANVFYPTDPSYGTPTGDLMEAIEDLREHGVHVESEEEFEKEHLEPRLRGQARR